MIEKETLHVIVNQFATQQKAKNIVPLKGGLINQTYLVTTASPVLNNSYILQQINQQVFPNPLLLQDNFLAVREHLLKKNFHQKLLQPIVTKNQLLYFHDQNGAYWRMFYFIKNTFTVGQVAEASQAYEAAKTIGQFLQVLCDMNPQKLHSSLPDFHNTALRYQQFINSINPPSEPRQEAATTEIHFLKKQKKILHVIPKNIPLRVTHNDTKISNVLFDIKSQKGVSVIDWDTLMPGWIIHDFGDMVRTFTNPAGEEVIDLDRVEMKMEFFEALTRGFLESLATSLTSLEKDQLVNGALLITYEQALRFLTDFLQGDLYYQIEYPEHNLNRARNQIALLQSIFQQKKEMENVVNFLNASIK